MKMLTSAHSAGLVPRLEPLLRRLDGRAPVHRALLQHRLHALQRLALLRLARRPRLGVELLAPLLRSVAVRLVPEPARLLREQARAGAPLQAMELPALLRAVARLLLREAPLRAVLNMGGFYLKLGQILAGMDILPRPWAESLRVLQRSVPPRPLEKIVELIERDLGCTCADLGLRDLSPQPIGAATIGQVHSATLRGRPVAVKVMHPDVERFVRMDFAQILSLLASGDKELLEPLERQQAPAAEGSNPGPSSGGTCSRHLQQRARTRCDSPAC